MLYTKSTTAETIAIVLIFVALMMFIVFIKLKEKKSKSFTLYFTIYHAYVNNIVRYLESQWLNS